ncbi:MAG: DUF4922 domain-containing protein [Myxococcota bacterium]
MSTGWEPHLATAADLGVDGPLRVTLPAFVRWQVARWPKLRESREALAGVRTRTLDAGARRFTVQWNPARAVSSTAKVDPASIAARPCFLCPHALPPEEGGLAFGDGWVILPNPAPILADHLVIAHRDHRPQQVLDALPALLAFVEACDGAMTGLYNGPRCGASAPDHLHLQAVAAGQLPEEGRGPERIVGRPRGATVWTAVDAGREVVGIRGPRAAVEAATRDWIDALWALEPGPDEPRVNLVVTLDAGEPTVRLFPRGAHRPACFFAEGADKLSISPGVIDMAGVVVTVRETDFERLDGPTLAGILREVTLPPERMADVVQRLRGRWGDG